MTESPPVLLAEEHGDVLLLTLNRPAKHNALNREVNEALGRAVMNAERSGARAIVITGAGERAFSAGADMTERERTMAPSDEATGTAQVPASRGGRSSIATTHLPVIAAVNGICYGGGAALAIGCDLRVASENATFRLPGSQYGLVVAASTLPRLVGAAKAKEYLFLAKVVDAEEALRSGLVNAVYPQRELVPAALEMAQTIAGFSVEAVQSTKRVIDLATLSDDSQAEEVRANRALRGSPEQVERFAAAAKRVTGKASTG
ncbi:MAG: enoyl-CoA hydratase/isomerase family protein [Dehalococcoidia bacterium]